MSDTRLRLRRVLASSIVLAALGFAAGCSDDPKDDPEADKVKDSPSATTPSEPVDPATDPNGPFVVAATAVAERSVDQVIQLHVMGTGTADTNALRDQIPTLAGAIHTELDQQITDATMMTPPEDSVAADLVAALKAYRGLAQQLSEWTPGNKPMPDAWFTALERIDRRWTSALDGLGELSGTDLLANVPELMLPT